MGLNGPNYFLLLVGSAGEFCPKPFTNWLARPAIRLIVTWARIWNLFKVPSITHQQPQPMRAAGTPSLTSINEQWINYLMSIGNSKHILQQLVQMIVQDVLFTDKGDGGEGKVYHQLCTVDVPFRT